MQSFAVERIHGIKKAPPRTSEVEYKVEVIIRKSNRSG